MNTVSTQKRKYELKARAEAQEATRARIAAAAAALHEEVGIGQTTVADIARRAGVQRLTVYNHFPDLNALLPACTAHWLGEHPRPDLDFTIKDPAERLRAALTALYGWYREAAPMQRRVLGERATRAGARRLARAVGRRGARGDDRGALPRPQPAPWSRSRSTSGRGRGSTAKGSTTRQPPRLMAELALQSDGEVAL